MHSCRVNSCSAAWATDLNCEKIGFILQWQYLSHLLRFGVLFPLRSGDILSPENDIATYRVISMPFLNQLPSLPIFRGLSDDFSVEYNFHLLILCYSICFSDRASILSIFPLQARRKYFRQVLVGHINGYIRTYSSCYVCMLVSTSSSFRIRF